jgi:hypothetical protein
VKKMFQCKNPECNRTFYFLGRISVEKKPSMPNFAIEVVRTVFDSPCCPFCGSKEFEPIPDNNLETTSSNMEEKKK